MTTTNIRSRASKLSRVNHRENFSLWLTKLFFFSNVLLLSAAIFKCLFYWTQVGSFCEISTSDFLFNSCQITSTETWTDIMYHLESGLIFIWIYLHATYFVLEACWKKDMGGKTFSGMCFSSPSGAFRQHDSHSIPSNPLKFFGLGKYSLVHCLLAPAGLWSGWSIKLIFFLFSASCCGLNLCVLSWPDHLSDRFLIHISQLKRPSLFGLNSNWFCSDLQPP